MRSAEEEHHISADVAWALSAYARATADDAFLGGAGLRHPRRDGALLGEPRGRGDDGRFHIRTVIGPDEYHEGVDDNAFTNWMARFNLRPAADAVEAARRAAAALGVSRAGVPRAVSPTPCTSASTRARAIEQFAGFYALERVDLAALGVRHAPADLVLGRAHAALADGEAGRRGAARRAPLGRAARRGAPRVLPPLRADAPRTAARSARASTRSSPLRLGLLDTGARYLDQTAEIDLGNTHGNAAGGVHAAALGSLWQAVVLGAGGVRAARRRSRRRCCFEPHLLPGWRTLVFPFAWRGALMRSRSSRTRSRSRVEGDAPLPSGRRPRRSGLRAEPGVRTWRGRREGGVSRWEGIS